MSEETKDNVFMDIWDAIKETDPNRTKKITGKKYQGDSINPNYIYEKLTRQFGPCGLGWGVEVLDESWQTGKNGDIAHSVRIGLWYTVEGIKSALIPGYGGTIFSGSYSSGDYTDDDATKKSLTDAITKASQLLGMSADIFGGEWSDSKYVAELKQKYSKDPEKPKIDHKPEFTPENAPTGTTVDKLTDPQLKKLQVEFKKIGYTDEQRRSYLMNECGVISCSSLTKKQASELIKKLVDDIPIGDHVGAGGVPF